jgi:TonB family protein
MLKAFLLSGALLFPAYAQEASSPGQTDKKADENAAKPAPDVQPSPNAGTRMRVSSKVAQTHLKKKVTPQYPQYAKEQRIQGTVVLMILVDTEGNVIDAKIVAGKPELCDATLATVKQWKYEPFLLNDKPVTTETTVNVNYELR